MVEDISREEIEIIILKKLIGIDETLLLICKAIELLTKKIDYEFTIKEDARA